MSRPCGFRRARFYDAMTSRADRITTALTLDFAPRRLEVRNDSARHAGHAGARAADVSQDGETHYHVTMVSARFRGQGRLARQRAVNTALAAEFDGGLHALSLTLRSDEEDLA